MPVRSPDRVALHRAEANGPDTLPCYSERLRKIGTKLGLYCSSASWPQPKFVPSLRMMILYVVLSIVWGLPLAVLVTTSVGCGLSSRFANYVRGHLGF